MGPLRRTVLVVLATTVATASVWFLIIPPLRALTDLRDPALGSPGVPGFAWREARALVPRYEAWARSRVARQQATSSPDDVSGTEWPVFGSLFFLWGLENLQASWDAGDHRLGTEPRVFARDAIDAAARLVADPSQAAWVRHKWGADYLHQENVFYRMLLIGALTSRERLLRDGADLPLLRAQNDELAAQLDASPTGWLRDYPNETYPSDVLAAWAVIRRADQVLGTDHSREAERARRGFEGAALAGFTLPPFAAYHDGHPPQEPRGSSNSYLLLLAPELWPDKARAWFATYEAESWQEAWGGVGFREYPKHRPAPDWFVEVDSGPVLAGHGISASAFGLGAARRVGRFDLARPLATELLATVWPLPTGVLGGPALLSNATDAPLLGEAAVLWLMTIQPAPGFEVRPGEGSAPPFVWVTLLGPLLLGLALTARQVVNLRRVLRPAGRALGALAAPAHP